MLDSYHPDRYSVGEIHIADWEEWASYYGEQLDELHMPYNFSLLHVPWMAEEVAHRVDQVEAAVPDGGWPNYVLGNHDDSRLATRFGDAEARVAAMLLLTLRGTPTIYYGDELGMREVEIAPEDQQDPWGVNAPGLGRDGCRTPMQWDRSQVAGFSVDQTTTPWLPLHENWPTANVAAELEDPRSILNLYRALLAYRKTSPALQVGNYRQVEAPAGCFAFTRDDDSVTIALNFTGSELELSFTGKVALTTYLDDAAASGVLRPHEGLIIES